ncbi:hypothetical protein K458DRAFT_397660 [Lentithecium fluviatile CBS 122367]|uniref:Uncharacterized protein n=1 Tax=Lentithecium fluviatile CBS 122367 TaxID=1168545 RepID=A0A6G1IC97_9PLEO|nr:hypothetical protein K458DRAFT_397660 [Lentithecium fluviatile CBS 122367]
MAVSNDIVLIFLKNQADLQEAVAGLNVHRVAGGILYGHNLTASGFGDSATDPAVSDIIVQPELGVIYTTSNKGLYSARF